MNLPVSAVLAGALFLVPGCGNDSVFDPGPPSGRFSVDSARVAVNSDRATFEFSFHFVGRPGTCSMFRFDVADYGYVNFGGTLPRPSPCPVDSFIRWSDSLHLSPPLASGDSVWAFYQFRGEFWEVLGSQRVTYGQFAFRDSVRLRVQP